MLTTSCSSRQQLVEIASIPSRRAYYAVLFQHFLPYLSAKCLKYSDKLSNQYETYMDPN